MLPDFVMIGAMKCGTTSLNLYLKQHPEIGMSTIKEPNFFVAEKNYLKGLDWYESLFVGSKKIYGEASTNYTKSPIFDGVPARMHAVVPEARLIYLVRDPVDRIVSHYIHNCARNREHRSFSEAVHFRNRSIYALRSKYYTQLQTYLEYYPDDHILIVDSYDLFHERGSTLSCLFSFLGVDSSFRSSLFSRMRNKSSDQNLPSLVDRYLSNRSVRSFAHRVLPAFFTEGAPIKRPEIDAAFKEKLIDHLKPDVESLRQYTGKRFEHWCL